MTANRPVAHIHLDNIASNLQVARQRAPHSRVMAVIKANAYGHGDARVAECLSTADAFAVARVAEGSTLRMIDRHKPIVVLEGFLDEVELQECRQYELQPTIHSAYQLELLPDDLPAWLKLNTGMSRLGFAASELEGVARDMAGKQFQGVISHFANADQPAHPGNRQQWDRLMQMTQSLGNSLPVSMANSGAVMSLDFAHADWVRPGIMLYGGAPGGTPDPLLLPGMTLTAPVIAVNRLSAGDVVGYGSRWKADREAYLAVVGFGYADGYPREVAENMPVVVAGQRRKLVGRVSMDMCTVLLEPGDGVAIGDQVEFWGRQLPIDEVADLAGTISYTLMTGLGSRVQRIYEGQ